MKPFTALFVSLAGFLLPADSLASAAELEWHQERVAALAQSLIEPIEALRADLEQRPAAPAKEAARVAVRNDIEHLHSCAKELAERLAHGAGRAETTALFREVEAAQSQALQHAREYPAPFDMYFYTDSIQRITLQLARYYGEASASGDGSRR
jgi:hypothetical protein